MALYVISHAHVQDITYLLYVISHICDSDITSSANQVAIISQLYPIISFCHNYIQLYPIISLQFDFQLYQKIFSATSFQLYQLYQFNYIQLYHFLTIISIISIISNYTNYIQLYPILDIIGYNCNNSI